MDHQNPQSQSVDHLFENLVVPYAERVAVQAQRHVALTLREDIPMPAILHLADGEDPPVHRIFYTGRDAPAVHGVMTQLVTLERILAARRNGVGRRLSQDQTLYNRFQDSCSAKIRSMREAEIPDSSIAKILEGWYNGLGVRLIGTPLHVLIELMLYRRHPEFRSVQEEALNHLMTKAFSFIQTTKADPHMPPFAKTPAIVTALVPAYALQELFGTDLATDLPARKKERDLARRVFGDFHGYVEEGDPEPGAELDIAAAWIRKMHLESFFSLRDDPAPAQGSGFAADTPPVIIDTAAELKTLVSGKEQPRGADGNGSGGDGNGSNGRGSPDHTSAGTEFVVAIRDAHRYLSALSPDKIKRITLEIAEIGSGGFNPEDTSRVYTVSSVPGREFLAYELIAWTYTGFRLVNPEINTGIDLDNEYRRAMEDTPPD